LIAGLAVSTVAVAPARADESALTLELGGTVVATRLEPSLGNGDAVTGSLGGAEITVRYALTNRLEVQATGFWNASATFVNTGVHASAGGGSVVGYLRRDVSRIGAAVGARFVAGGSVWRIPLGGAVGVLRTSYDRQDLLDVSDPQNPVSYGLRLDPVQVNRIFVAPFAGIEWVATDHLSVSLVPRLELPLGSSSAPALVLPFTIGWSWYLL
jgi:hypothetical protein